MDKLIKELIKAIEVNIENIDIGNEKGIPIIRLQYITDEIEDLNTKEPDIYDAEHPDRKKAIRIINSIPVLEKLDGEEYYEIEDLITEIINKK